MCKRQIYQVLSVGLLLAASASADVIWSGSMYQRTYHDVPAIDFNLDGTNDFTFNLEVDTLIGTRYVYSIEPANGQVVVDDRFGFLVPNSYPLAAGAVVTSSLGSADYAWTGDESFLFSYSFLEPGEEGPGGFFGEGYLGVSFEVDASTHYGWIEMSHGINRPSPENQFLYIHGWAWETEVDTPIRAGAIPEPSSGILTMVGSLALLQLARSRRRRKHTHKTVFGYRSQQEPKEPERW